MTASSFQSSAIPAYNLPTYKTKTVILKLEYLSRTTFPLSMHIVIQLPSIEKNRSKDEDLLTRAFHATAIPITSSICVVNHNGKQHLLSLCLPPILKTYARSLLMRSAILKNIFCLSTILNYFLHMFASS